MNTKNLPLKFGFVGLLILVSLWSLLVDRGLRFGIDLRGGHSLVFEIRTHQAQAQRLREQKSQLQTQRDQEPDAARKQELSEALKRIESELAGYESAGDEGNLAEQMIAVLKRRVDPQGLRNLEWKPLGQNRIEVRMPAARRETQQARMEYLSALESLEQGNIQRSEIRRMLQSTPQQRPAEIQNFAGGESELSGHLLELAGLYDRMEQARMALSEASGEDQRRQVRTRLEDAEFEYETQLRVVEGYNVNLHGLQTILANYVPPVEQQSTDRDELRRRTQRYETGLEEVRRKYPNRTEQIDRIVAAYQRWAQGRQELEDPADLKRLIAGAGVLEFRVAPYGAQAGAAKTVLSQPEQDRYIDSLMREGPEGVRKRNERYLWFATREEQSRLGAVVASDYQGLTYVLLSNTPGSVMLHEPGPAGWSLADASYTVDQQGRPAVSFTFDEGGAKRFSALTGAHVGDMLAVLLDDEMYSAPVIQTAISRQGIITGSFTVREVNDLIQTLRAGSLPARLNPDPVAESTFGPGIGEENLRQALRAGYISLIVVAGFMLVYYLLAGMVANVAMMLNLLLVLGAMSLLSAVFTLPGIAGVILTVGMTVDANVLIYERLREEQRKGQSVRMALKNAYERAFSAIFDSNLTTLITCSILGWVATEEVKGFAITLGLGVLFNLFTAVLVTRWVYQFILDRGWLVRPISMISFIGVPKIDWMSKRYFFWTLSAAMMIFGIGSLVWQGKDILGIEFSSGTQMLMTFKDEAVIDGQLPNDALVRRMFTEQASRQGLSKLVSTSRVEKIIAPDSVESFLRTYSDRIGSDGAISRDGWMEGGGNPGFFDLMDADRSGRLERAELSALPSTGYQVTTTETQVSAIREVARLAFGDALENRSRIDFDFAAADESIPELGITIPTDGRAVIDTRLLRDVNAEYRQDLGDFEGGVLLVVKNLNPPISRAEMVLRIREMRFQPDFATQQLNRTAVFALGQTDNGRVGKFAVAVAPVDAEVLRDAGAWERFAELEAQLVGSALQREEAMVASSFDPAIAGEIRDSAVVAIVLSWLAIVAYLWFRFGSVRWGLAAVVCLAHDTLIAVGLVAMSGWLCEHAIGRWLAIESFKIDLPMIAAFLTVIGYSVNDTIVVFDRIRENRGKLVTVTPQVINASINQMLSRTLLTGLTTLMVIMVMYVWGGQGIHAFNFVLLVGISVGTYSSVAVASPLLMGFRRAVLTKVITRQPLPAGRGSA